MDWISKSRNAIFISSRVGICFDNFRKTAGQKKGLFIIWKTQNNHQVKQFLGLGGWNSSFVPYIKEKTASLTDLLYKECLLKWTEKEEAFINIKQSISIDIGSPTFSERNVTLNWCQWFGIWSHTVPEVTWLLLQNRRHWEWKRQHWVWQQEAISSWVEWLYHREGNLSSGVSSWQVQGLPTGVKISAIYL